MLKLQAPALRAIRSREWTLEDRQLDKISDHIPPPNHLTDEDTELHLPLRSDLHLSGHFFWTPSYCSPELNGPFREIPHPPKGMLEVHPLPSYTPRKHRTAWACIYSRCRHSQNTHANPYHSYLAGWEIVNPCGLESPSFTPGILPQSTQQRSICKNTHTWNLLPSQPSSSSFGKGHAPPSAPYSNGTMIPPTFNSWPASSYHCSLHRTEPRR